MIADWRPLGVCTMLVVSGIVVRANPAIGPMAVLVVLTTALAPWMTAWREAEGTALRGALAWAALALGLGICAQVVAMMEPIATGRPTSGRMTYVMTTAILAALTTILNARRPGERVWAFLMVLLLVVFLIPWLEGFGRMRRADGLASLRLDSPWTIFYGFLGVAGTVNYLPTRYGRASLFVGGSLVVEYVGLRYTEWPPTWRAGCWMWSAWLLGASCWLARLDSLRCRERGRDEVERIWFWFRDHWGTVWALRTAEQFNRSAALGGWPYRLSWQGLVPVDSTSDAPVVVSDRASATLRGLIRRFARPERLDRAAAVDRAHSAGMPDATI